MSRRGGSRSGGGFRTSISGPRVSAVGSRGVAGHNVSAGRISSSPRYTRSHNHGSYGHPRRGFFGGPIISTGFYPSYYGGFYPAYYGPGSGIAALIVIIIVIIIIIAIASSRTPQDQL